MTTETLTMRTIELMVSRQPTRSNRFLLYADEHRLDIEVVENLPRTAWIIKSLSADDINNGPSRLTWYKIYDTIDFLHNWGILS